MAEITAATAIGWVVSPVIKMVIDKIKTFIEEKYFQKSGIEDDMKKMNTTLLEILSTMTIVEKQRIVDPNQVQLVRQIKDAVYDAEDCMDEFDYELLEEESEKLQQNKFWRVYRVIHQAIVGNSNSKKKRVGEVSKSLDQTKTSAKTLLEQMNAKIPGNIQLPEQENRFLTSSLLSEEIFIGREKEQESIIEWILEEKVGPPTIIPIIGQGGMGKTTLAQLVFNDPKVKSHFEPNQIMWLTVSDNFDKLELTKQMLKYLCANFSTIDATFDMLQKKLETELASNKILLMLDDVWYVKDDNKKHSYEKGWLEFLAPFRNAKAGSKIIMTTRQDIVVTSFEHFGLVKPIYLDDLNDDDGWSLLKLKAFDGGNLDKIKDLEPIGRKIVKKLKGLPLAIIVVGPRLRGKSDIEEWERILNDDSLDNGIMEVLHRSYENLPGHLQRCFAYCSLFPKDYNLKRDRLVHMWIAHGFVHPKGRERLEDVGKSYFNELIVRSFIQVIKRNNKEYYVMHDLKNDLACHVSQGECYILKKGDTLENLGSIRHLSITPGAIHLIKDIPSFDKLRTLILLGVCCTCFDFFSLRYTCSHFFSRKMKRIRVLDMKLCLESLPQIRECKHLRYLCFRNCKREISPDAFSKLHLLTVLFIRRDFLGSLMLFISPMDGVPNLSLPQGICSMSRLEFIDIDKSIIVNLGGQAQLHSLLRGGEYAVLSVQEKKGWKLSNLREFNNIKGTLRINELQNVASREEAIEAQLDSKEHVTKLWLCWSNCTFVVKSNKHNEVIEALRPHPNIESLNIDGFPGDKWPSWLESNWLSRMTHISIERISGFKRLPAIVHLSQLRKVEIRDTATVSRIGDEFYGNGTFPSLEELQIVGMEGLEELSSPCGVQLFPKLRILQLHWCPELFSLPEMESFSSLELVQIVKCPKIKSLPKLPVSLLELAIERVHHDLEEQIRNKNGQEWDKVAAVSGCLCEIIRPDGTRDVVQHGRLSGEELESRARNLRTSIYLPRRLREMTSG